MSRAARAARIRELLGFDLALAGMDVAVDEEARLRDAPCLSDPTDARDGRARRADAAPLFDPVLPRLVGFDEAGRGALAGPVVVGCVALSPLLLAHPAQVELLLGGVDDSKALTPRAREEAYDSVARCARWAVGCASAAEIDAVGIVVAAACAARRAYRRLGIVCDLAVFDRGLSLGEPVSLDVEPGVRSCPSRVARAGREKPRSADGFSWPRFAVGSSRTVASRTANSMSVPGVAFTRGDMRSLHVAAASIVAKVTRDRLMTSLDPRFSGYEFAQHKGYGTERHLEAISRLGPSTLHRATFLRRLDEPENQSC